MKIDSRSLRDILESYCKRGWYLFPIKRETKLPAIKDNLKLASNDIEQLLKWAEKFPKCNWGLSLAKSGLVAVDVDAKGLNPWEALCFHYGEPQTLKAASGSGVGSHYVFKAKVGKRYRGKIVKGIDVKHNGFIAIYPSIHPQTKNQYRFENPEESPADYEEWLAKLIEKDAVSPGKSSPVYKFAGAEWYKKIIGELKEKEFGYDQWVRLGMALHSAFQGSEDGLELYLDLTQGVNFQDGDLEKARHKWESFKSDGGGVGIGSFIFHARSLGCAIPTPSFEEDREAFGVADGENVGSEANDEEWKTNYYGHKFTENAEFIVKEINRRGFAMLGDAQEGTIIKHWTDSNGVEQFRTMNVEMFKNALKDHSLKTIGATCKAKLVPAAEIWLKSTKKSRYRNVVFRPDADFEDLNLWSGIPCAPIMNGDVSLVLELINVLCGGNEVKARYLTMWLAHMVQRPEEKCVIVPVIIGEQGTGKGLFTDGLLYRILTGSFYIRLDKPGTIKERFNAEQSRKFLTVLDEASWRGDHELVGIMKSLTGSSTMTVEEKFGGRYTIENYSRYIITSNDLESVRIEVSNRRYLVLESSNAWKGTGKFKELANALRGGNLHRAFYGYLLGLDISDFDPFMFPEALDTSGEDTKVLSMGPVGQFWYDKLFESDESEEGKLPFISKKPFIVIPKQGAFLLFQEYCQLARPYGKHFSIRSFLRETERLVPGLDKTDMPVRLAGKVIKVWGIDPQTFAEAFCKRLRITLPADFEPLALVDFGDFDNAQEI